MKKVNYHTHTYRCLHAVGADEDYVGAALESGFELLGFSDHTPWKYQTDYVPDHRMPLSDFENYVDSIRQLQAKYRNRLQIHLGLECEYFPEYMPWLKELIAAYEIEYVLFGNHYYHSDETGPYFGSHTVTSEMLRLYEESIIDGLETGIYSCLAHPDLFMASYPRFDRLCEQVVRRICQTAVRLTVALEYNLGYRPYAEPGDRKGFPCKDFWSIAKDEGCTAIIGIDAHDPKAFKKLSVYRIAEKELKELGIKVTDRLAMNTLKQPII